MKRFSIFLFTLLLVLQTNLSASYSSDPKEFVKELVNDAIIKLSDKNLSKEQKSQFIENIALENVDIKALSLYTLGELRKTAEKKKCY